MTSRTAQLGRMSRRVRLVVGAVSLAAAMVAPGAGLARGDDGGATAFGKEPKGQRKLGKLERRALEPVLEDLALVIDEEPEGKRIRKIIVKNLNVFSKHDSIFQFFNIFHKTTRPHVVEREILLRPGDVFDRTILEESERKLRDPLFTSVVVIVPVENGEEDTVDLLVVTRDMWSLRLNSQFELQGNQITYLTISGSENNFAGFRKLVAAVFRMDQAAFSVGPLYVDKNVFGRKHSFRHDTNFIFNRDSKDYEGSESFTQVTRPFWSLSSRWAWELQVGHRNAIDREFRRRGVLGYDAPETREFDNLPWEYREKSVDLEATGVHSLGDELKHRFSLGYALDIERYSVLDDFPGDAMLRSSFERDVLPRSETSSAVLMRYRLFTPDFVTFKNIDAYDLPEDERLGPELVLTAQPSLEIIGSDTNYLFLGISGEYRMGFADRQGLFEVYAGAGTRIQGGELIDNDLAGRVKVVSPPAWDVVRAAAAVEYRRRINEENNRLLILGGERGLRGFDVGEFFVEGDGHLLKGNFELRSESVPIWISRTGLLLFYDVGHVAPTFRELHLHHDIGIGLRILIPQLSTFIHRLDWAFPLNGPKAGFPGRVTAGITQVF